MIFLIAIFIAYIVYGLVGSLFPTVWPQMAIDISIDYTLIGVLVVVTNIGAGISSAFAYVVRRKLGTSKSIALSLGIFAISLLLFLNPKNIFILCVALMLLGIGNGIIDTVANSYIIKAYDSGKISLLHACWGFGSSAGPVLIGIAILNTNNYKNGFLWVTIILVIVIAIFLLLKAYWDKKKLTLDKDFVALHSVSDEEKHSKINLLDIFKVENGLIFVICFIIFGATNSILNAWMPTFAVGQRGLSVTEGATTATCFFVGITVTRILLGLIAKKVGNYRIIILGAIVSVIGYIMLYIKNDNANYMYVIAIIIGIGIAPLVPFLHSTVKEVFDEEYMGIVVSCCNSLNLFGSALATAFTTFFVKIAGIDNAQILLIVFIVIGLLLYIKIHKKTKQNS